jgi:hypothetical protein
MVLSSLTACGGEDFESTKDVGTGEPATGAGSEDCATGQLCTFQSDCPTGQRCNLGAARCIDAVVDELARDCSQTLCVFPADCPDDYACNLTTSLCFKK